MSFERDRLPDPQTYYEAAALPSATKTEALAAFPAKETGNKCKQSIANQAQNALIFGKEAAHV